MSLKTTLNINFKHYVILSLLLFFTSCSEYVDQYAGENSESGIKIEYNVHYEPSGDFGGDDVSKTELKLIYPDKSEQVIVEDKGYFVLLNLSLEDMNLIKSQLSQPTELPDNFKFYFNQVYNDNIQSENKKTLVMYVQGQNQNSGDFDQDIQQYIPEHTLVTGLSPTELKFIKRKKK